MFGIQLSAQMVELLRGVNGFSILLRLCLAIFCGGIIGVERGKKGRPAGFRTHVLVCLGSALTVLTNQYMMEFFGGGDHHRHRPPQGQGPYHRRRAVGLRLHGPGHRHRLL